MPILSSTFWSSCLWIKYNIFSCQIIQAWKKRGIENLVSGFQVKPATKDPDNQELIKELYEQIGQLSVEREWLKKIYIV
jgi:hypothetical protein